MGILAFIGAVLCLLAGHLFKVARWGRFVNLYEEPPVSRLSGALGIGYALNFFLPLRLGEIVRAIFAGRKLKNGIGLSAATIILDRFLDVVAVAVVFLVLLAAGVRDSLTVASAKFYVIFTAVLLLLLLCMWLFSGQFKKLALKFCSLFNDRIKLGGMRFFWTLLNTFRDFWKLDHLKIILNTIFMWAGYLGSYALLAAGLSRYGAPVDFLGIFAMLFSKTNLDSPSM